MAKVKTICVCLPVDRVEELRTTAAKLGISVSALVNLRLAAGEKSSLNAAYGLQVMEVLNDGGSDA